MLRYIFKDVRVYINMKKKTKINQSEVHAYLHIIRELTEKKGWSKNQIYTQQECLKHPEIKKYLVLKKPENVIEVNPKIYYVLESKNERNKLNKAIKEAREDYANEINKSSKIKSLFITGIAGNNKEGFIAKSQFFKNGEWNTITENGIEVTGLLSKQQIEDILSTNNPNIRDVEITEEEFLETAEEINEILHENSINKDYRAKFISAILLAMSDGKDIDLTQNCEVLIDNINSRVKALLRQHNKLNFSNFIKIDEPSSTDNHVKIKEAIKQTYQQLLGLNIRSAMNSGKDVLGKFYEVFLKYGNGAKDIGIVLTPRHITKFASEVLDINHTDLVLDPSCGTGGFLVSAYDEVRRKKISKEDFMNFKKNGLYGIELQDSVISLALVNMIFRGDGKNNMIEGDCFKKWLNLRKDGLSADYSGEDSSNRIPPITKVMMNPPFALRKSDEKEYRFVEHSLNQMQNGGMLFAVLPISVLVEKETEKWRRNILLRNNRLVSVLTFPEDLFYPSASVGTVGLFLQKGIAHNFSKDRVYFARCPQDGFVKKKGIRKEGKEERNVLEEIKDELKNFIKNQNIKVGNIPEFKKVCLLEESDESCELVPEAYLDGRIPTKEEIENGIESMIREVVAFKVKYGQKLK